MWNHSRAMEEKAARQGVKLPVLSGAELADVARYLGSLAPRPR